MKINIYGPAPEMEAIAEIVKRLPPDADQVYIKAPLRNAIDRRPCQHPNWLFYDANIDNVRFINLSQSSPTSTYEVKLSWTS